MKDFRRLLVWRHAHDLVLAVYRHTEGFPFDERFGLTSQLRRASTSIAANIAEGCGRATDADLARFLSMSLGSASEVEYHLLLARDLGLLTNEVHARLDERTTRVKRMLTALRTKVRSDC